jgi:DNA helicase-2/ATP-dependent DNA helicase PcrA
MSTYFEDAYTKLNKAQKQAVDTIEGPVMVIAGPGTGKTQILALRIANILQKTDTSADGILCLTFTNSGVRAMQERLRTYIGSAASRVAVLTFHSFGMKLLEEFYGHLDFETAPKLIDDLQSVALCDEILHTHDWKHIRSRANPALYFNDIKSLISLLKRERISPQNFLKEIEKEIDTVKNDPENISSRGPTKGNLKAEALKTLEGLERTKELVTFYEYYEQQKKERGLLDYDDVLENIVKLVEVSDDARDTIRERYLYVLVDEHQDSSGVQNEFLARVWSGVEQPNVFVVGDDRQLIYGFGGASLSSFEGFQKTFDGVQVITLTDNYRSTQMILDSADHLLKSSLVGAKLIGNRKGDKKIELVECDYPRDEIISAGLAIKEKIKEGMDANECAILVPKNTQVKNAMRVLADLGIPVASGTALKLFELPETQSLLQILKTIAYPVSPEYIAVTLVDRLSGIPPLVAHEYLVGKNARKLTLVTLLESEGEVLVWAEKINSWVDEVQKKGVYSLIQKVGDELLLQSAKDHEELVRRVEVVRTMLHLVLSQTERNPKMTLEDFLAFIARLEEYGTDVPLAVFSADTGVKVMTLHGSKGLEFESVWIAHMDEKNLSGKRGMAFTLPTSIKERIEEKDELVIKRQLYVAITRAKHACVLSYARHGYTGGEQMLAHVIADMPQDLFDKKTAQEDDVKAYVVSEKVEEKSTTLVELAELVKEEYADRNVSVSALNNFFECPWKWYFRNLLQLPEPETISLQFGNVVHGTIEKILKQKLKPNDAELKTLISESVQTLRGLDDIEEKRIEREALVILSRWVKNRLAGILPEYKSEYPFYNFHDPEFEHLKITGKIDLLEHINELDIRVTDFKTGKPKLAKDIEKLDDEDRMSDYLRQLAMYSYLLSGKSHDTLSVVESCLEFVEAEAGDKNAVYSTKISGDQISHLKDDIRDYDKLLKSGKWLDRPCNFKSYGKVGAECDYCRLAKIYK